ncbi:MAG: hypothetical protein HYW77_01960 [Parcubacteria group bacterium]|nr:hypothetical protein [Parcubacteria group bacterium]
MKTKLKFLVCIVLLASLSQLSFSRQIEQKQILNDAIYHYFNSESEIAIGEVDALLKISPNDLYYLDLRAAIANDLTLRRTKGANKEEKLKLENTYRSYLDEAILIGEEQIKTPSGKQKDNCYGLFNLSSLYARKANFLHDAGKDSEAVDAMIQSIKFSRECLRLNPEFQLPNGILGIAQYELGDIWGPFRFFGGFIFKYVRRLSREVKPDKNEGLKNLFLSVEYQGNDFRLNEARWVLAEYLFKEKRYLQAYTTVKLLSECYPKNLDIKELLFKCEAKLFLAVASYEN